MTQQTNAEASTTPRKTNWKLIAGVVIGVWLLGPIVVRLVAGPPDPREAAAKAAVDAEQAAERAREQAACAVRKADGSPGDRACDLVELCKDVAFQNRKVDEYTAKGDVTNAVSEGAQLRQTLAYMAEYRHADVVSVCGGTYGSPPPAYVTAVPSTPAPAAAPTSIARCTAPPTELFHVGDQSAAADFSANLGKRCPGAALHEDGRAVVAWQGKEYLIETAAHEQGADAPPQTEVTGLWLK